jgi:hypothetical protein
MTEPVEPVVAAKPAVERETNRYGKIVRNYKPHQRGPRASRPLIDGFRLRTLAGKDKALELVQCQVCGKQSDHEPTDHCDMPRCHDFERRAVITPFGPRRVLLCKAHGPVACRFTLGGRLRFFEKPPAKA